MSIIARLGVILALNTVEFIKGLDDATKKSRDFEQQQKEMARRSKQAAEEMAVVFSKIGIAATATGLAIFNTFKEADQLTDLAKGFDITIEALLSTQSALQGAGGNAEDVAVMFQKLAVAQDGAKEGSDEIRASFERLGISGHQVDSLKLDELFRQVANSLSSVEDAGTRAALAQDLLGKAVKGVNWSDFVEKYKEFNNPELVASIQKNADAWEKIEKAVKNIKLLFQELAAPMADALNNAFLMAEKFKELELIKFGHFRIGVRQKTDNQNADFFNMLPPSGAETPMLYGNENYLKKSTKELAARKAAATEVKRLAEEQKRAAEQFDKYMESVADKEKTVQAELKKLLTLGTQNINNLNAEAQFENDLLDLELNRHLMSEDTYQIKKKTIEQAKDLNKLTADYLKFETDARAEMESATGLDAGYAKDLYNQKMQNAAAEYTLKYTNLQKLQEKEIEVIKNTSEIRRQYEKEDRDIAYKNQLTALNLQYVGIYENLKLEDQAYLLSTNDYNLLKLKLSAIQEIAKIEQDYNLKRQDIQKEFERKSLDEQNRDRTAYEEKIKNIDSLKQIELDYLNGIQAKREENYANEISRQKSWSAGWAEASKEYFENMEKAANQGAAAFEVVIGNMNAALAQFVNTGKFNFQDLTVSILRNLLIIQMQAQASAIFSFISSAFKPSTIPSTGGGMGNAAGLLMSGVPRSASGGAINSPTLVGENGAELFIPNTPGTIIPNGSWQQAAAGMNKSGFVNNGTYIANMSAIDTQSATQFLSKNKSAVWGAYQSANRSIPISR